MSMELSDFGKTQEESYSLITGFFFKNLALSQQRTYGYFSSFFLFTHHHPQAYLLLTKQQAGNFPVDILLEGP